jgi:hypothetical protein
MWLVKKFILWISTHTISLYHVLENSLNIEDQLQQIIRVTSLIEFTFQGIISQIKSNLNTLVKKCWEEGEVGIMVGKRKSREESKDGFSGWRLFDQQPA